jgi:hypothetical protein
VKELVHRQRGGTGKFDFLLYRRIEEGHMFVRVGVLGGLHGMESRRSTFIDGWSVREFGDKFGRDSDLIGAGSS